MWFSWNKEKEMFGFFVIYVYFCYFMYCNHFKYCYFYYTILLFYKSHHKVDF